VDAAVHSNGRTGLHLFKITNFLPMAKAAKTAQKKDPKLAAEAKNYTKVIKAVRSPKTGAYTFKEQILHKDKVKDFLAQK
jgi:hypothetical protein